MPQTHKLVRDAVLLIMRDDTNGFNAKLAEALPFYGTVDETLAIQWSPDSAGVLYGRLGFGDVAVSKLRGRLTLQIAPNGSQWTNETRGIKWTGIVGVLLIFHLRYSYRELDDAPPEDDTAVSIATAIEDAVIEVFQHQAVQWPEGLIYAKPPDCPEGYQFELLDDGCEVTIAMSVGFKVDATF
jgi:hypothetical protein